jgi:hypothetical protein
MVYVLLKEKSIASIHKSHLNSLYHGINRGNYIVHFVELHTTSTTVFGNVASALGACSML